jgi:hypothetical protein
MGTLIFRRKMGVREKNLGRRCVWRNKEGPAPLGPLGWRCRIIQLRRPGCLSVSRSARQAGYSLAKPKVFVKAKQHLTFGVLDGILIQGGNTQLDRSMLLGHSN